MKLLLIVIFSLASVSTGHRNYFGFRSFGMETTQEPRAAPEPKPIAKCKWASRPKVDWPGVKPKRLPRQEVSEPTSIQEQRELREQRKQRKPRELSAVDEVTLRASGSRSRTSDARLRKSEKRMRATEKRMRMAEKRMRAAEKRTRTAEKRMRMAEKRMRTADSRQTEGGDYETNLGMPQMELKSLQKIIFFV